METFNEYIVCGTKHLTIQISWSRLIKSETNLKMYVETAKWYLVQVHIS